MRYKNYLYFLSGMIAGLFLVFPVLKWLGMPSSANVLVYVFGAVVLIFFIILIPIRKYKN